MKEVTDIGTEPVPISNIKRFVMCPYVNGQNCPQNETCPHWVKIYDSPSGKQEIKVDSLKFEGCAEKVKCFLINKLLYFITHK
jgi:hypothetical protein